MRERLHPLIIRITHWLNFIALGIMVSSGMRIYNASPIFGFEFPSVLTLGGWLGGARQWHFFAMWIFVINGLLWWLYNAFSKHGRETTLFRRSDVKGVLPMIKFYLRIEKKHPKVKKYNALQKLAYTSIPLIALIGILSGMEMYWPVQMQLIGKFLGGYDGARIVHFCAMSALVLFFLGHLVMVITAGWGNFLSMITGSKKIDASPNQP
jgi:thiosulfate reductase cytochrome b subunit